MQFDSILTYKQNIKKNKQAIFSTEEELLRNREDAINLWCALAPKKYINLLALCDEEVPNFKYSPGSSRYKNMQTSHSLERKVLMKEIESIKAKLLKKSEKLVTNYASKAIEEDYFRTSTLCLLITSAHLFFLLGIGGAEQMDDEATEVLLDEMNNIFIAYNEFDAAMNRGYIALLRGKNLTMSSSLLTFTWLDLIKSTTLLWHVADRLSAIRAGKQYGFRLPSLPVGCVECYKMGMEGVKPISELVDIGKGCKCGTNCRAKLLYFRSHQEAKTQHAILRSTWLDSCYQQKLNPHTLKKVYHK